MQPPTPTADYRQNTPYHQHKTELLKLSRPWWRTPNRVFTSALVLTACLTNPAEADWLIGPIIMAEQGTYEASQNEFQLLPYIAWESKGWHIGIDSVSYERSPRDDMTWALSLQPRFSFQHEANSDHPYDIKKDDFVEGSIELEIGWFPWVLGMQLGHDVSGVHRGVKASADASLTFPALGGEVGIAHALHYRNQRWMQHQFGVSSEESSTNLNSFVTTDSLSYSLALEWLMPLTNASTFIVQAEWEKFPRTHLDSPLVNNTNELSALIGWIWNF